MCLNLLILNYALENTISMTHSRVFSLLRNYLMTNGAYNKRKYDDRHIVNTQRFSLLSLLFTYNNINTNKQREKLESLSKYDNLFVWINFFSFVENESR